MIGCLRSAHGLFGLGFIVCIALAQAPTRAPVAAEEALVEGQVLSDADGQPLRRAHVTLRPLEGGLPATGVEADDRGNFVLRKIPQGRYSLLAERDGYLASGTFRRAGLRMPSSFYIGGRDKITGVTFRLRPWAVLAGKIKLEDGAPGVGVRVELYREYRARGRHGYAIVSGAFANDRGEYRVYGLQPGAYLVAAVYERAPAAANYQEQPPTDAEGREIPVTGYATTFFPDTEKLSQALPVRIAAGEELPGIDLSLRLVPKVKVRGFVTSAISGVKLLHADITLARADASSDGTIVTPARALFDAKGDFEIKDVVQGSYVVRVQASDAGKSLSGRRLLTVSNDGEDNVELVASAVQPWSGVIRIEGADKWPSKTAPRVSLDPRSDSGASVQVNVQSMRFDCFVMADETYDVLVDNLAEDFYVSAVRAGGSDVRAHGLSGAMASPVPFEIVLDSRGGRVSGRVFGPEDGDVWSGASLTLIPDPPQGRLQDYRESSADQYGQFQIRGVAPGKYTLVAWLDEPPCDVYDPDGLAPCRTAGMSTTASAAGEENISFTAKAPPKR